MDLHDAYRMARAAVIAGAHRCATLCGILIWDYLRRRLRAGEPVVQKLEVQTLTVNERKESMNKPFEFSNLLDRLKSAGLPMLEKDAKIASSTILDWVSDSCVLEGGVVAMIAPGIPYVKEQVLKLEDKIDGVAGN